MKYYLYLQKPNPHLRYDYWVMVADESLTKFQIWSRRKSFNCNLYTEIQVLEIIRECYPEAIRIPKPLSRWNKIDSK
jgi:hypothetical protein